MAAGGERKVLLGSGYISCARLFLGLRSKLKKILKRIVNCKARNFKAKYCSDYRPKSVENWKKNGRHNCFAGVASYDLYNFKYSVCITM